MELKTYSAMIPVAKGIGTLTGRLEVQTPLTEGVNTWPRWQGPCPWAPQTEHLASSALAPGQGHSFSAEGSWEIFQVKRASIKTTESLWS